MLNSKSFLLGFVSTLFLSACGGGGGGGGGSSPGEENANPVPAFVYLELTDAVFDQYTGVGSTADLSSADMGQFVAVVLSDTQFVPPVSIATKAKSTLEKSIYSSTHSLAKSSAGSAYSVNESNPCAAGGQEIIQGALSEEDDTGVLEIEYAQCNDGSSTLDGKVLVNVINANSESFETVEYYKKVLITEAGVSVRLSGRLHTRAFNGGASTEMTADLVAIDQSSLKQIKLQNYLSKFCNYCSEETESFSGRIYLSDYGYLDVSTPDSLKYLSSERSGPVQGKIHFGNQSGQSFQVTFDAILVERLSFIDDKLYFFQVETDIDADGVFEVQASYPQDLFDQYVIYDIADADSDGLANGWEKLFGLDPGLADDASLDSDGDGYSDETEFSYYGNPLDSNIIPLASDLSVNLSLWGEEQRAGQPRAVKVWVSNPNAEYGMKSVTYSVTKSSNVEWGDLGKCALAVDDADTVWCHINEIGDNASSGTTLSVVGEAGEFTVKKPLNKPRTLA